MQHIEVEYNRELKPLEAVLSGVKQPGDFFVSGAMEMPMPRVEVGGAGTLSFPVPDTQIVAIVRSADRAPYGRGEETIVDTAVRNVWQIAPNQVKIGGKSWLANFENILSKVKAGLGCEGAEVSAEFYKLLVYDRGGFFLAHRDTEKADGMFGTLIVTLPSPYSGGDLRIRHAGREVTVETNAADPSEISYAAFYADCEHEVLPVQEGNRVCLVYNLIQTHSKGKRRILRAPEYEGHINEIAAILDRFLKAADAPAKIAWLLDHQYSPAGLSFPELKGADAAKARVLAQAAARAQCAVHLGIVHIGESGVAEDYDEAFFRSRNRYRDYDAEDEEDSDEDASFDVATVDDSWQYVDEWRDTEDRVVAFGRLPLAAGELLPAGALDGEPPDRKRLTEASGNEGASYERSYHRAAVVLWRQVRSVDVLLQAGVVATLPYLGQLVARGKGARAEAISAAERMVQAWADDARGRDYFPIGRTRPGPSDRVEMIAALTKLSAPDLLERFLTGAVTAAYDGSENAGLVASIDLLGDGRAAAVLSALVSARMAARPPECSDLLLTLSKDPRHCFAEVAESAVAALDRIGTRDAGVETFVWDPEKRPRPLGPEFIENLLLALEHFKDGALCVAAAEKIASRPEILSHVALVVPAIERLSASGPQKATAVDRSVRHLWTSAAEFLLQRSEVPPEPPADWSLHVKLSCSCEDCRVLQAFARDPVERVHRFRMNKERRRHLHGMIDKHRLDMTHETDRVGSPQTLVCKKDRRTFDRRVKEYQDEIAAMGTLVKLVSESGNARDLSKRMEVAVKRAGYS